MVQEFTQTDAFTAAFNEQAATNNKFIVIFTGSINEQTNESWCPDCVQAKPNIARITEACNGRRVVLKGIVTRDEWRGNAAHAFRQSPYGAEGVPTMAMYEGENQLHKVDDLDNFADNDLMDMFLDELE